MRGSDVGARLGTVTAASSAADLWFAWVGDHARDVDKFSREYLSTEERARLHDYRSPGSAERYVLTRSLVRLVLGHHLGIPPRDLRVSRTDSGKPVVTEGVHFNVSHSGDLILLALSGDRAVGVDVERRREVERVEKLVERWLSETERSEVAGLTQRGASPSDAFLRIWSLKEARLKAVGVGISGAARAPLHAMDVLPLDHLLDSLERPDNDPGYVGALAFA